MASEGPGLGARLENVVEFLAAVVSQLDPGCVAGGDAARLAELFARGERVCAAGKATMAGRAAQCRAWSAAGARSPEEWLAAISRSDLSQAKAELATAGRLQSQPEVDRAFRAGQISPAQAHHISRAAEHHPHTAPGLLQTADQTTMSGLSDACRQVTLSASGAGDDHDRYRRIHRSRYLRAWTDEEGAGRISVRLTPDAQAKVLACIKPFHQAAFSTARAQGRREHNECYAADALVAMASTAARNANTPAPPAGAPDPVANTPAPPAGAPDPPAGASAPPAGAPAPPDTAPAGTTPGGISRSDTVAAGPPPAESPDPAGPAGPPEPVEPVEPAGRGPAPAMVIAVIDHGALTRGHSKPGERCEIDGVGPVPVSAVRNLMNDAFLVAAVKDGTDIRSVVHLGRYPTAHQRSALIVRDRVCVVPGCNMGKGLEIDHVDGWSKTHTTTIDHLARLCRHHHHLKTYDGWTLTGQPGNWQWHPPPPPTNQTA